MFRGIESPLDSPTKVMDGGVAAVIVGIMGFVGTLFMAGMVCAGSDRRGGSDDETLEM